MGGCAAVNCNNNSRKKHRMFKFPTDPVRRRIWAVNCHRDAWVPGPSAQLCSAHFEESQFEQNRADNWKKLNQTAIPTLFDVLNPPPTISPVQIKGIGKPKPGTLLKSRILDKPQESENLFILICLLQAKWKKIPLSIIQTLVESMPRRVKAVIAFGGGSTNFNMNKLCYPFYHSCPVSYW